jgi:predicted dehydrogenase
MDVGIYCLNFARYLSGEEPTHVSAQSWQDKNDPRFGEVESSMAFTLKFPSGALAACTTSYDHHGASRFHYMTEKALVECDPAFGYGGLQMKIRTTGAPEAMDIPNVNHFTAEMDHFAECVMKDQAPRTPGEEGLQDMKIIRKLYESAETGKTLEV